MPKMQEILKSIVEAETVDERMQIVEDNQDMFNEQPTADAGETETKVLDMETQIETLTKELANQKQKYRDRFFGGSNPEDSEEPKEEETEEIEEVKSLDDILNNKGGK